MSEEKHICSLHCYVYPGCAIHAKEYENVWETLAKHVASMTRPFNQEEKKESYVGLDGKEK